MSKPLTFGELAVGDKFISLPISGDDSGHGGFRRGHYLFKKVSVLEGKVDSRESLSSFPASMPVIKVLE